MTVADKEKETHRALLGTCSWCEPCGIVVPLALQSKEGLLKARLVNRITGDDASRVVGEPVVEAGGEEVDRAMTHANVGELGLVEVDVGRVQERLQAVLEPFGGDGGGGLGCVSRHVREQEGGGRRDKGWGSRWAMESCEDEEGVYEETHGVGWRTFRYI